VRETREEGKGRRRRERIGERGGRTRCRHKWSVYADNGDEVQQVQGLSWSGIFGQHVSEADEPCRIEWNALMGKELP
jgi:hypothetical protein